MKKIKNILYRIHQYEPKWIYNQLGIQCISIIIVFLNIYMPQFIYREIFEKSNYIGTIKIIISYCCVLLITQFFSIFLNKKNKEYEETICYKYKIDIYSKKSKVKYEYMESNEFQDLCKKLDMNNMNLILSNLESYINSVFQLVTVVSILGIVFAFSMVYGAFLCLIVVAKYYYQRKLNNEGFKYFDTIAPIERQEGYMLNVMGDFNYGKEIRLFDLFPVLRNKLLLITEKLANAYKNIFFSNFKVNVIENTTNILQMSATYFLLAIEVVYRKLTIGDFTMYFNAVNQFCDSMSGIFKGNLSLNKIKLYEGDIEKYFSVNEESYIIDKEHVPVPQKINNICFCNVSFKYPGCDDYVIKDLDLCINEESNIALVGLNGAGKTTLIKLLLRLYSPTGGKILLNNVDIQEFPYDEYISSFATVFQDFKLFAFSLRDNICFDRDGQNTLLDVLKESDLEQKINELVLGIDTPLYKAYNEEGTELSGGESQKLAIARALYKNAPIIILDEPTSALDPITEFNIYKGLAAFTRNKISIFITHRLATTRFMECIYVLENGRIIEKGNHEELMKLGRVYFNMYSLQAEYYTQQEATNR